MWVTQPAHLRKRDLFSIAVITLSLKTMYLVDNENGVNRAVEPELVEMKIEGQNLLQYLQVIPLFLCIFLENKIGNHYSFDLLNKFMTHALTLSLISYTLLMTYNQEIEQDQNAKSEGQFMAQNLGFLILLAVAACMLITTIHIKFLEGKSWDNVSVRCGLLLTKAAMLIGGKFGPLSYFCMILQIYFFALIVNRRRDSKPG